MWSSEDAEAGKEAGIARVQPFFCQRLMLISSRNPPVRRSDDLPTAQIIPASAGKHHQSLQKKKKKSAGSFSVLQISHLLLLAVSTQLNVLIQTQRGGFKRRFLQLRTERINHGSKQRVRRSCRALFMTPWLLLFPRFHRRRSRSAGTDKLI